MPVYKGATMSWDTFKRMTAYDVENDLRDSLQSAMREYYGYSAEGRSRYPVMQLAENAVRLIPRQSGKPYRTYRKLETYGFYNRLREMILRDAKAQEIHEQFTRQYLGEWVR